MEFIPVEFDLSELRSQLTSVQASFYISIALFYLNFQLVAGAIVSNALSLN